MMYSYANVFISDDAYLAHYGRSKRDGAPHGSGRYPLGSGEEPYQNTAKDMRAAKREEKREAKAQRKQEKYEEKRSAAIASGNALKVRKYADTMTNEELEEAMKRIQINQRLDQLASTQKTTLERGEEKVTRAMNHIKTATGWLKIANDAVDEGKRTIDTIWSLTPEGRVAEKLTKSRSTSRIIDEQDSLTNKQLKDAAERQGNLNKLEKIEAEKAARNKAQASEEKLSEAQKAAKRSKALRDSQEAADDMERYANLQAKAYEEYSNIRQKKRAGEEYNEDELAAARQKVEDMESKMYAAADRRLAADRIVSPEKYDEKAMKDIYKEKNGVVGYYQKLVNDEIGKGMDYLFGKNRRG